MHEHNKAAIGSQTFKIITQFGDMLVVRQGLQQHHSNQPEQQHNQQQQHQTRPVIMTFHDIGLNSELQFARFCECDEVKLMLQTFTMIHVNFVGQEFTAQLSGGNTQTTGAAGSNVGEPQAASGAGARTASTSSLNNLSGASRNSYCENLPADFKYPNVDQMAESVVDICTQLRVRSFIALAVGAGAYVVASLALLRPDLVDGLFLINPVVSSCSITEWLYFKMSAIASNHHIRSDGAHEQAEEGAGSRHQGGFRRLLNAAHIHLPHQSAASKPAEEPLEEGDEAAAARAAAGSGQSSSRLRRLILSRNFKLGHKHQHQHGSGDDDSVVQTAGKQPSRSGSTSSSSTMNSASGSGRNLDLQISTSSQFSGKPAGSSESLEAGRAKRPPLEYLMYHHFGPSSFQRYRRSSDTPSSGNPASSDRPLREDSSSAISASSVTEEPPVSIQSSGKGSRDSSAGSSAASSQHGSPRSNWRGRKQLGGPQRLTSRSNDSLAAGSGSQVMRQRSGSASLSASQLASFASERQRNAYMQSVYKHYFCQLNPNNLWQFVQSFAKRKTLNLRKDCGAAAHAAAAAAALGTSICTAFVGMAPPGAGPIAGVGKSELDLKQEDKATSGDAERSSRPLRRLESRQELPSGSGGAKQQQQERPSALVAGTKVKRTFTCQTLIMCSNVQMHCERAFKLMSLLNPLQATWIKTDHLLVLDERPEKVCQALRLFLQGIGYSMSTYERRLRLSSATGSASSADSSTGSGRSFAPPSALLPPEAGG